MAATNVKKGDLYICSGTYQEAAERVGEHVPFLQAAAAKVLGAGK
jgi:hypothetical protein